MPKHLAVYYVSSTFGASDVELTAQTDDVLTISAAGRFFVSAGAPILEDVDFVSSIDINYAYVSSPTIASRIRRLYVLDVATKGLRCNDPDVMIKGLPQPYQLTPTEELSVYVNAPAQASATAMVGAVILRTPERAQAPQGTPYPLYFTCTGAGVANRWVTYTCQPEFALEAGQYTVIAAVTQDVAGYARLIFPRQVYRPPVLLTTRGSRRNPACYKPALDLYYDEPLGTFTHQELPQLQIWSTAAVNNPDLVLWVVRQTA